MKQNAILNKNTNEKKCLGEIPFYSETFDIHSNPNYPYIIGEKLLCSVGSFCEKFRNAQKVCIISDDRVFELYGSQICTSLKNHNFQFFNINIKEGEQHKNINEVVSILDFLHKNDFRRSDLIISLGGGIIGDISGFVASIYLRGIRFINIPTTTLAAIDSSTGGKTGVNFDGTKNMVGSFYQPSMVVCSIDTFSTLSKQNIKNGIAESIKIATIQDRKFFNYFKNLKICEQLLADLDYYNLPTQESLYIIKTSVKLKEKLVSKDEKENHARKLLNFGHTFAHAIESASNFSISHGEAVAIGMVAECDALYKMGITQNNYGNSISTLMKKFSFDTNIDLNEADILSFMEKDKKNRGLFIDIPVIKTIGNAAIFHMPHDDLPKFIKLGLERFK